MLRALKFSMKIRVFSLHVGSPVYSPTLGMPRDAIRPLQDDLIKIMVIANGNARHMDVKGITMASDGIFSFGSSELLMAESVGKHVASSVWSAATGMFGSENLVHLLHGSK